MLELIYRDHRIGRTWQELSVEAIYHVPDAGYVEVEKIEGDRAFIHDTWASDPPVLLFLPDEVPSGDLIKNGRYCQIWRTDNGNLFLRATEEAHEEGVEYFRRTNCSDDSGSMWDLLEDLMCNSDWELLSADQTGDLTDSPILAAEVVMDDEGDFVSCSDRWAFMDCSVQDPLYAIFTPGAFWTRAE